MERILNYRGGYRNYIAKKIDLKPPFVPLKSLHRMAVYYLYFWQRNSDTLLWNGIVSYVILYVSLLIVFAFLLVLDVICIFCNHYKTLKAEKLKSVLICTYCMEK